MTMVSMNAVWEDTMVFVRREAGLLVPLALATLLVGDVVNTLSTPSTVAGSSTNLALSLMTFAAILWTLVGQLAVMALALRPGSSVGEALVHGFRRLPTLIGAAFLVGIAATLVLMPALVGVMQSGVDPNKPASFALLPGWVSFYILVFGAVAIWLSLRLSTLNALIVDKKVRVIEALRTAFAMTRGIVARLILVAMVYFVVTTIMTAAIKYTLGAALAVVGRAIDSPFVGAALTALATGVVSTALSTVAAVFLAMLYRRIKTGI